MRVRGRVSKHQALQRARSHATSEETVRTLALLELDRRPSQSESEPLALPRSGVTAASLR
jgi:hypothetical protein